MIDLPNEWQARPHQAEVFDYMFDNGMEEKRAAIVNHRRAGKDSECLNLTAVASQMRVGTYWHMLPTLNQGRKVVWEGIDKKGRRMIDQAFPKEIRDGTPHESEMRIRFRNGSVWYVTGSDNYDSLVGTNPVGVIFSEYSVADPSAWDYIRPILLENGGWALFIYTPRGKNHGYRLFEMAKKNPKWFCQLKTVEDTVDNDGNRIITDEMIQEERDSGMPEDKLQQEYYCSFEAELAGAYYGDQMRRMKKEKRIGDFPWLQDRTVNTIWDLGIRDDNFIIFAQQDGEWIRIIDCIKGSGRSLQQWIKAVKEMPYIYENHTAPHDIENREQSTGKTRKEFASEFGIDFDICPRISLQDGIEATRTFLGRVRINESKCGDLIDCLGAYRKEYDEKRGIFKDRPVHDWASHGADCARYTAVSWIDTQSMITSPLILPFQHGNRTPRVITSTGVTPRGKRRHQS